MIGSRRKALRTILTEALDRPPSRGEMRRIKRAYTRGEFR